MTSEKYHLETGALNQFVKALDSVFGEGRFLFKRLLNPPEPDALCYFDGQKLHVEVAHIYGTESDVKKLLGRTGKSAPTLEQQKRSAMVPLNMRLITPLNNLLADKAIKKYQTSRVWLLVRSAFPLWSIDDFIENQAQIKIPATHPFEKIWLLCGPQASFGVLQIA